MAQNPLFRSKNEPFRSLLSTIPHKAISFPQRRPCFPQQPPSTTEKKQVFPQGPRKRTKKWIDSQGIHPPVFRRNGKNAPFMPLASISTADFQTTYTLHRQKYASPHDPCEPYKWCSSSTVSIRPYIRLLSTSVLPPSSC